mmetsp:Transcript_39889/g.44650  ORF Transcript_39889/g.44650 Transcript_39889/m.44650 type:complete len:213 (+) Transcript_39889:512-1150(+)
MTSRFSTTIFIYSSLAAAAASAGVGSSVDATSVPAVIGVGFWPDPQEEASTDEEEPFPRGTKSSLDDENFPDLPPPEVTEGDGVCRIFAKLFSFCLRTSLAVGTDPRGCSLYHCFFARRSLTDCSTISNLVGGFNPTKPNCSKESTFRVKGPAAPAFFGARWRFFLPLPFTVPKNSSSAFLTAVMPANGSSLTAITSSFFAATLELSDPPLR